MAPDAVPTRQRLRSASGVAAAVALSLVTTVVLAREPSAPVEAPVANDVAETADGGISSGESILDSDLGNDKGSSEGSDPKDVNAATTLGNETRGPLTTLPIEREPLGGTGIAGVPNVSGSSESARLLPPMIAYSDLGNIYVIRPDGTGRTRLTDSLQSVRSPDWSPDGTRIVYMSRVHGGLGPDTGDLYVVDADGNGLTRLTNDINIEGQPAWSPDGAKIAFSEWIPTEQEPQQEEVNTITIMNADGSGTRRTLVEGRAPDWSPDGRWIAYNKDPERDPVIRIVRSDGSEDKPITDPLEGSVSDPAWSPDGRYIAFFHQTDIAEPVFLFRVDLLSGRVKRVAVIGRMDYLKDPDWTPDGRILYEARGDFYVIALDGTKPRLLIDNPDCWTPCSNPDSYSAPHDPAWRPNSHT